MSAAASMFPPQPAPSGRGWDVVSACVQTPGGSLQLITETTQSRECAAHGYCEFLPKASVTPPNTRSQGLTTFWTDLLHNLGCKIASRDVFFLIQFMADKWKLGLNQQGFLKSASQLLLYDVSVMSYSPSLILEHHVCIHY